MLRTTVVIIWTISVTLFMGVMTIILSFLDRNGNIPHKVARIWAKSILAVSGVRVRVRGMGHLDDGRSHVYMANHQSHFDIPVLLAHLPGQFRWLAKHELFGIPVFGYAMARAGYISIDRSDRKSAFESLKRASRIIRNGVSVLIFPEGTRSGDGTIRPFKKGGFIMAVDSGVPVIPIVVTGTRHIMPKNQIKIRRGDVNVEIRPPIRTSDYTRKTKDLLIDTVREAIVGTFESKRRGTARW